MTLQHIETFKALFEIECFKLVSSCIWPNKKNYFLYKNRRQQLPIKTNSVSIYAYTNSFASTKMVVT